MIGQETTANAPKAAPAAPQSVRKRLPLVLLGLILVGVAGYFGWKRFYAPPEIPKTIVALSGRIEGDDSAVASKIGGRVREVRVREGDQVRGGDIIAILDDEQVRAREQQARGALDEAQARVLAARQQIAILKEQLQQSQLQVGQAKQESQGRVSQSQAELAAAEAALAQQEAAYKLAVFDKEAYTKLAKSGAVSERQGRQAETTAETQAALVTSARRRVESARAAVASSKASLITPDILSTQGSAIRQQIVQQQTQVVSAEALAAQAKARLAEAQANRQDLQVPAPFDGTVATRTAEPGEVVNAGTPLLTLIDLTKVYLRGFVPEGQIGRVRVGQAARIFLDSAPTTPIDATVSRVDPQATFTPENTYFRDDRVKQVVGVKLQLKAGTGFAKPGMPADGEILVEGDRFPEGTRKR